MKPIFLLLLIFSFAAQVPAQERKNIDPDRLNTYYALALNSAGQKDYPKALSFMDSAVAIAPQYAPLTYARAKLLVAAGDQKGALAALELLLKQKQQYVRTALQDSAFNTHPYFQSFLSSLHALEQPVSSATEFVRLEEQDLVPEGVAFDPVEKALYISSIYKRKIVKIDASNRVTDFTSSGQDSLLSVLGMEVDPKRRHLWVCSAYDPANEILHAEGLAPQAAIHKLDLETGKLLKRYTLQDTLPHFFNDLTVLPNGDVYFTDSGVGTAYRITVKQDQIAPLFERPFLISANGITKDSKGENLFIASWLRGIIKYNISTGKWKWLEVDDPAAVTSGADGLAYYKGSLIVNSPLEIGGILRLRLNTSEERVRHMELLEYRNPLFGAPTTGEIAGDHFYFIANAGLEAYDRSTGILDKGKLTAPVILQLKLKP